MRYLGFFLAALAASSALTPLVMAVARRQGLVAQPSATRWHRRPTALFGGVAIYLAFLIPAVLLTRSSAEPIRMEIWALLVGMSLLFVTGLVDDIVHLKPTSKLVAQIVAASLLVASGVYFKLFGVPLITMPLTVLWVVGITNAFNLLDNMDGLAGGIAAIGAAAILAFNLLLGEDPGIALLASILCGALVGFLFYNFYPARIFMGDCGSMSIGFALAGLSIMGTWHQASNVFLVMAVPVLILGVPIFDTAFVTVTRRLRGQAVSEGGRDHTSHRLVALGFSEKRAVLILYAVSAGFSLVAVMSFRFDVFLGATFVMLMLVVLLIFGVFLGQEKIYHKVEPDRQAAASPDSSWVASDTVARSKQHIVEVFIDVAVIGAALLSAYLIKYEGQLSPAHERQLLTAFPVLLPIKMLTFWAYGLYRRLWNFVGVRDLVAVAKAVLTSSALGVLAMWLVTRLEGYPLTLFLLDGLLLLLFTASSRVLFLVFEETLAGIDRGGRRLLIVGAGRGGEMVLRTLRSQPELGYRAVGFIDDNLEKWGRSIHGIRILGGRERIEDLGRQGLFDEIVVAIPSLEEANRDSLVRLCRATGKPTRVMEQVSTTFLG